METLKENALDFAVFYYNPNIDTRNEYEKRKEQNKRFAEKLGVPFLDADYDNDNWLVRVKGLEDEPERGKRCTECFLMRLERTALYAHENGFSVIATSLGLSRWKDMDQVNACGHQAASRYQGLKYWDYNWRQKGGSERSLAVTKREGFYRQTYCGCIYSRREYEKRRAERA